VTEQVHWCVDRRQELRGSASCMYARSVVNLILALSARLWPMFDCIAPLL
jgi:hypothetical protein